MFGFVVVGLIINAKITTPYVAFAFVFVSNISLCYDTFRKRFKAMKKIIFKYWKKYWKKKINFLPNAEIRKTLPESLFWDICRDFLPIEPEISAMLANMLMISSISMLALAIIVFFGEVFVASQDCCVTLVM